MVSLDNAVLGRYKKGEYYFEILIDPDLAMKVKKGEKVAVNDLMATDEVFEDAYKSIRATSEAINKVFGTKDLEKISTTILKQGEIQVTTEQKKRMMEDKRKKIINLIAKSAVDPRTHLPHPAARIEGALEQVRVNIDPFKSAEEQVDRVVTAIKKYIPLKMETDSIQVRIPSEHAPRAYWFLKKYNITKEEWRSDGSFLATISLPAGMQGEFYDGLNKATAGNCEAKVLERI